MSLKDLIAQAKELAPAQYYLSVSTDFQRFASTNEQRFSIRIYVAIGTLCVADVTRDTPEAALEALNQYFLNGKSQLPPVVDQLGEISL